MASQNRIHFPNLDALRTLAFLAVFFRHALYIVPTPQITGSAAYRYGLKLAWHGSVGVNFFFVLSGFLITYLLLEENQQQGRIQLGAFYMRRALRIWPLYFACVAFGFGLWPWLKHLAHLPWHETARLPLYALFMANFDQLWNGEANCFSLGVLWSVSVEEQFYLVWPVLLLLVRPRWWPVVFGVLLLGSLGARLYYARSFDHLYQNTFCVFSDLVIGGFTAWLAFWFPAFRTWVAGWRWPVVAGLLVLAVPLVVMQARIPEQAWQAVLLRPALALVFAALLLHQVYGQRVLWLKAGRSRWLSYWGRYTYGLYCLHIIGIQVALLLARRVLPDSLTLILLSAALALPISAALAWVSFRILEQPFLRLKPTPVSSVGFSNQGHSIPTPPSSSPA